MGYFEHVCQFCGVSFAICRLRRPDEPTSAAWTSHGSDYVGVEAKDLDDDKFTRNCKSGGCEHWERGGEFGAFEHVAGPGCVYFNGYSGHRLTLEEMKGCRAIQCLDEKTASWEPEADDQDFELDSNYFLTGVGDGSPEHEGLDIIEPIRHGVRNCLVFNSNGFHDFAIPFHPTCFEIFKTVSCRQFGFVDVEGLWYWRKHGCSLKEFFEEFPRAPEVKQGYQQWWHHEPGCEYLAANPINIPGFQAIPSNSSRTCFIVESHFKSDKEMHRDHIDGFQKLSVELKGIILNYLGSKDIANLRAATPAFRSLPNTLFRRLVLEELPWIWEADPLPWRETDWHQFYCNAKHEGNKRKGMRNRKRIWKDVNEVVKRIGLLREQGMVGQ